MQATIGDRICIHGSIVGHPDKNGEIVEVHGDGGTPPYLVKFDDGKTRLIYPGPDAVIEHPASADAGHDREQFAVLCAPNCSRS